MGHPNGQATASVMRDTEEFVDSIDKLRLLLLLLWLFCLQDPLPRPPPPQPRPLQPVPPPLHPPCPPPPLHPPPRPLQPFPPPPPLPLHPPPLWLSEPLIAPFSEDISILAGHTLSIWRFLADKKLWCKTTFMCLETHIVLTTLQQAQSWEPAIYSLSLALVIVDIVTNNNI